MATTGDLNLAVDTLGVSGRAMLEARWPAPTTPGAGGAGPGMASGQAAGVAGGLGGPLWSPSWAAGRGDVGPHRPDGQDDWAGVCPGNNESACKHGSGRTRKGSKWLRVALVEAAHAAARTKDSYLAAQYARLRVAGVPRRRPWPSPTRSW
jgi:hypothetical protein